MKTSELTGAALNWAVATITKAPIISLDGTHLRDTSGRIYSPSTDWAQGGPIIEREKIGFWAYTLDEDGNENPGWYAETFEGAVADGSTPLIAAMRCYVASKLGDEVEIPKGLQ